MINFAEQSTFDMDNKQIQTDIHSIRTLMERSAKFISLSGLSGLLAGCFASLGGLVAYTWVGGTTASGLVDPALPLLILLLALSVLSLSIGTAVFLASGKAKKQNQAVWNPASKGLLTAMTVPLMAGGLFAGILFFQEFYGPIVGVCLIFYGLSLYAGGQYTFNDVKTLGLLEIGIGLLAVGYPAFSWYAWMLGFGLLHIVYGTSMHFKYERRAR